MRLPTSLLALALVAACGLTLFMLGVLFEAIDHALLAPIKLALNLKVKP